MRKGVAADCRRQHQLSAQRRGQGKGCDVAVLLVNEPGTGGVPQQHAQALVGAPLPPPLQQVMLLGSLGGGDAQLGEVRVIHEIGLQAGRQGGREKVGGGVGKAALEGSKTGDGRKAGNQAGKVGKQRMGG